MFNTAMILAGGLGTRFSSTDKLPKPMIKAGNHYLGILSYLKNLKYAIVIISWIKLKNY